MSFSAVDASILWPALVAGLLVTATHVPLGMQVLARGIVFIDLAIAQIAGCGVLLADRLGFEAEGIAVQVSALAAALAGGLLLTWTEKAWPDVQEAVIGVVFVLGATGGLLLLASNPHGSEHLHAERHVRGRHQQARDERGPEDRPVERGPAHAVALRSRAMVSSKSPKRSFAPSVPPTVNGNATALIFARSAIHCDARSLW